MNSVLKAIFVLLAFLYNINIYASASIDSTQVVRITLTQNNDLANEESHSPHKSPSRISAIPEILYIPFNKTILFFPMNSQPFSCTIYDEEQNTAIVPTIYFDGYNETETITLPEQENNAAVIAIEIGGNTFYGYISIVH